ncbi:hypothetical protein JHN63_24070 [Streptomyces sp. MBT65]|uniref:hypothetical protein n=1 Tax=Streptomyces sp. MBT65 TaxID=1488395 RepID=UPI00190AD369|nr:hypothetical protein [Streptomyces sp. MBT65]MBK3576827.1 hypothetical protein [Streptomyces sp. MBT65]
MFVLILYVPALVFLALGTFGLRDVWILRRRGVRAEGRCGGTSWNADIPSIDVIYRDDSGARQYVTMAAEDLGIAGDESVVGVVYDPLKPDRATTEKVLKKSMWKTQEGYLVIVGLCIAAVVTALTAGAASH